MLFSGHAFDLESLLNLRAGSKKLRVLEEKLTVGGKPIYNRELAQVHLARSGVWFA
jgi:hypothetical protein